MSDVARLLVEVTDAWVADPEGAVVWAGDSEGRRGVRMRQQARDMTTVWFAAGDRTVRVEAYVLPAPARNVAEVYRQCLVRNATTRRMAFALDRCGDLVLVGRIPVEEVTDHELEMTLGEIYDLIEVAFRGLVAAGFEREKKTPG